MTVPGKPLKNDFLPWIMSFMAAVVATLALYIFDRSEHDRFDQTVRLETLEELSQLRADIESRLNAEMQLYAGMVAHISLHPDISEDEIHRLSGTLMESHTLVRSMGIAKQFTIFHVHPVEGNEAALGFNYLTSESQREPVLRAVGTRKAVLAGPVELVQGGQALIGRLPVFIQPHDDSPSSEFWGIVSIVLDLDLLYQEVGLTGGHPHIEVAIRGRDGLGQFGDIFYGDPEIFEQQSDYLDLSLPGGRWRIAGKPTQQLLNSVPNITEMVHILGTIIVLLITTAVFFLTRQFQHQKAIIEVQKQHREEIWHTATHDRLTGLPNRHLFNEELAHFIAHSRRNQEQLAVLFLDLDNFKDINDAFGHRVGDRFLQAFASRLSNSTRDTELVARLGGDEFAVVAVEIETLDDVIALAERITEIAEQDINIDGDTLNTAVSIGIALCPGDGETPDTLVQHADLAMYSAKNSPYGGYAFFTQSMNEEVQERKLLVDDMRQGLAEEDFYMVYQPIIDIEHNEVIGVEALARWQQPVRGAISPAIFIPAAETSGLILPFGDWSTQQAAQDISERLQCQQSGISVSINLSPIQLHRGDPMALVENVLTNNRIDPEQLDIEITESAILEDVNRATKVVKELRLRGVSVTIDDFGTGYSSLSHLQKLPVTRIKIDTSFVQQIGLDQQSEAIVKATLFLAKSLDIRATAEGVETKEQLEFLQQHGCSEIQGYYFSKPLRIEKACEFISNFSLANVIGD